MRRTEPMIALVVALAVIVEMALPPSTPALVRAPVGLVLLFAVGVVWSSLVFHGVAVKWPERLVAALGLTVSIVIVCSLAIHLSPWHLTTDTWSAGLAFTVFVGLLIGLRFGGLSLHWVRLPRWRMRDVLACSVVLIVLVGVVVVARRPLAPPSGVTGYTQLWMVPDDQGAELGVASYEFGPTPYRLELAAADSVIRTWDLELRPNERWSVRLAPSDADLTATLYRGDETVAYRSVGPVVSGSGTP